MMETNNTNFWFDVKNSVKVKASSFHLQCQTNTLFYIFLKTNIPFTFMDNQIEHKLHTIEPKHKKNDNLASKLAS